MQLQEKPKRNNLKKESASRSPYQEAYQE